MLHGLKISPQERNPGSRMHNIHFEKKYKTATREEVKKVEEKEETGGGEQQHSNLRSQITKMP